jgi:hypothetical protein
MAQSSSRQDKENYRLVSPNMNGVCPLVHVLTPEGRAQAQQRQPKEIPDADRPENHRAVDSTLGINTCSPSEEPPPRRCDNC